MELSISNDLVKGKNLDADVNEFIKELQKEVNKNELKQDNAKKIKIDEKSDLSIVNNIAKNNKMTIENRNEFFLQERLSLFELYNKNKRAGELYYIADKGPDNDFYVFTVNKNIGFKMMNESELPIDVRVGDICREKNGEIHLSKEETKEHSKKMEKVVKDILEKQELDGGYKREFTKNDLVVGDGYEGIYFKYSSDIGEELGKKAGLPLTMIDNFLENDINKVFEDVAIKQSKDRTIYATLPQNRYKLFEFSNGNVKEEDYSGNLDNIEEQYGNILTKDKSGKLVEDKKLTKLFQKEILEELKSNVKSKYNKICNDYEKEGHIYEVEKNLDENFIPTITLKDISQNRFFELEDLNFIKNRYAGEGIYTVKNGEYYKIDIKEKIQKNNTIDKEKEDDRNFANIMSKKYDIPKEQIEEKMKEFMLEKSQEEGVVIYTGYDKVKDEYYMDYYMEGSFDEREIISKKKANNMEVGTFMTMGRDEFDRYSVFFDAYELRNELEEIIKNSI